MSLEYKCSECGERVEGDLLVYRKHAESHIMDEIRKNNPDWEETDGVCKKCVEFYLNQMTGE